MNRVLVPLALALAPGRAVPAAEAGVRHCRGDTMGTSWSVSVVAEPRHAGVDVETAVLAELDRVVAQMSHWEPASDLCRFNAAAPGSWHLLADDFYTVLECALAVARNSGGAYDPTIGASVDLWGFGPAGPVECLPAGARVREAKDRSGWAKLELDRSRRRARQPGGLALDLSSIAKGYAVDAVALALEGAGFDSYLVEIGGELRGIGVKPDGQPWWVGLEHPPGEGGNVLPPTVIALHGLAVATSGDYRRHADHDGRRYAHTIDPRSGAPVAHAVASVTVVHPECMVADALSTALLVMGMEDGFDWARQRGLSARFIERVDSGFHEILTPALAAMLE